MSYDQGWLCIISQVSAGYIQKMAKPVQLSHVAAVTLLRGNKGQFKMWKLAFLQCLVGKNKIIIFLVYERVINCLSAESCLGQTVYLLVPNW